MARDFSFKLIENVQQLVQGQVLLKVVNFVVDVDVNVDFKSEFTCA